MMNRMMTCAAVLIVFAGFTTEMPAKSPLAQVKEFSLVVEFTSRPSSLQLADINRQLTLQLAPGTVAAKLERFAPYSSPYFDRLFEITLTSEADRANVKASLAAQSAVRKIEEPTPFYAASVGESLTPAARSVLNYSDPFVTYQWGLATSSQHVQRPINDIDTKSVGLKTGLPADIGLDSKADVDNQMKKEILVAVIDSGVDYNHEDLIGSIYKNRAECDGNGLPPVVPMTDSDGNGYKGDCMGYDFTVGPTDNAANKPLDDMGHGTHVSGIIAAQKNNKIGVAGVSNKIKIVPLKVMANVQAGQDQIRAFLQMGLTDKVAKAILYAVKMKVDVINLSMGWPRVFDTQYLDAAIAEAQKAGITIVASAGNNNTFSTVLPCSYEGVLCVAATGIDNGLTSFSNYGGQVEISAPGEEILSTFPKTVATNNFDVTGYEVLDGTSQSAPYISAAVGVLKGHFPGISEDEVRARIFASSQPLSQKDGRHIEFGTLKIAGALAVHPQVVIAPDFKALDRVNYSTQDGSIKIQIPIKNYWLPASGAKVVVESQAPQIQIVSGGSLTTNFQTSESKTLNVVARLIDPSASSNAQIKVTVTVPGQNPKSFLQDFFISRSIVGDPQVKSLPISLQTQNANLRTLLSVPDFYQTELHAPEYYWIDAAAGAATLHVLKLNGTTYQENIRVFQNIKFLEYILRVPTSVNTWGYILGFVDGIKPDARIRFSYYDQNLNPTGENFVYHYAMDDQTDKNILQDVLSASFMISKVNLVDQKTASGTTIKSLAFIESGKITSEDKNPNPLEFEDDTSAARHIYFMESTGGQHGAQGTFKLRTYDNYLFMQNLRSQLGLSYQEDLYIVDLLPQPFGENNVRVLFAYGSGDNKRFAVTSASSAQLLAHKYTLEKVNAQSTMLATGSLGSITDIRGKEAASNMGATFAEKITDSTGQVQYLTGDPRNPLFTNAVKTTSPTDIIVSFHQAFRDAEHLYSFIETGDNMVLQVNDLNTGTKKSFATSIHRTQVSEVVPVIFSEKFTVVTYRNKGVMVPAMFVDASQLFSSHLYITYGDPDKGLISPAEMDIDMPAGCSLLNPAKFGKNGDYAFALICHEGGIFAPATDGTNATNAAAQPPAPTADPGTWSIRILPMVKR